MQLCRFRKSNRVNKATGGNAHNAWNHLTNTQMSNSDPPTKVGLRFNYICPAKQHQIFYLASLPYHITVYSASTTKTSKPKRVNEDMGL